ncbi:hypothetical protein [Streptomyces sp. NBC_00859]|uniref:hypothetical protein n=1 Tax=Streptomyces sp. NBC_00859 TaxID=2903682 RepID=UPI0038657926|nr:hypothetical protein OG584_07620 [Streptomyces sp. NBC_00859]
MTEKPSTRNELSGNVEGPVVQTGAVHGDVVFHAPVQGPMPRYAETFERLAARAEAQMNAEDAAEAAARRARSKRLQKVMRRKRVCSWLFWVSITAGAAWVKLTQGKERGETDIQVAFVGFFAVGLLFLGYAGAKYEIRYGRPYPWSSHF